MDKFSLDNLSKKLGIKQNNIKELLIALTHSSYYSTNSKKKSNSRYVFLGMFGFKSELSRLMFEFLPGSGTQLQNKLGQMFSRVAIDSLFDTLNLKKNIAG